MKEFLSSSTFLWLAIGSMSLIVVIALLWRNTVWEARGITPTEDVERLRERMKKLLPKSFFVWAVIGVIVLATASAWSLYGAKEGALTQALQAPSPTTVWEWTKNYWLWIVLILAGLFFAFGALGKPWAKAARGMVVVVAVALVGALLVYALWGEKSPPPEKLAMPILSMPANEDSPRLPLPAGQFALFTGDGFETHCVYTDGSEGIVGDDKRPCKDGPVLFVYVRDTSGRSNSVTYRFVK